jgi:hypothetical protein
VSSSHFLVWACSLKLIIVSNIELLTVDTMTAARTYVKGCTLFFMKSDPGILGRPMTCLEGENAVASFRAGTYAA